jgi:hypothetical protein
VINADGLICVGNVACRRRGHTQLRSSLTRVLTGSYKGRNTKKGCLLGCIPNSRLFSHEASASKADHHQSSWTAAEALRSFAGGSDFGGAPTGKKKGK